MLAYLPSSWASWWGCQWTRGIMTPGCHHSDCVSALYCQQFD